MAVSAKVASAYVDLVARTAAFKAALQDATNETKKFSAQTRAEMNEAKASMALLGEEIGVRLPRHLRTFVAGLPGVATAMSAAFSAVAVLALIDIVWKAGEKIVEFAEKNEAAAQKNAEAWTKQHDAIALTTQEVELSTIKLENHIAKLEHKPENKLAEAIAETAVATARLDEKLKGAIKDAEELLKNQSAGIASQLFLGESGSGYEQTMLQQHSLHMAEAKTAQDKLNESLSFQNSLLTRRNELEAMAQRHADYNDPRSHSADKQYTYLDSAGQQHTLGSMMADYDPENELSAVKHMQGSNRDESAFISATIANDSAKGDDGTAQAKADAAKATKDAAREAARVAREATKEQAEIIKQFVEESISDYRRVQAEDERVTEAITKTWEDGQKQLKEYDEDLNHTGQRWKQFNDEMARNAEQAAVNSAHQDELRANMALATGAIGPHAAALAIAAAHLAQYNAQLRTLQDEITRINSDDSLTGVQKQTQTLGVQGKIDSLDAQKENQDIIDAQATLSTTWTGMVDGVFDEIISKSHETEIQLEQIAKHTIDSLNTEMAKSITGQKTNYHAVFQGAAESLAKSGLEKVEGMGLQALGLGSGGKLGSKGNPMYTKSADGPGGGVASAAGGGIMGWLNDSNWASSLFGGKLFGSGSIFGGGHALGGDVMAGVPIDVGEMGRERFTPSVPGHITPNSKLGGGDTWNIDARNTDPALSRENFAAALHATRQQAIHDATMASHERSMRVPR
jgi:hypothetical protein